MFRRALAALVALVLVVPIVVTPAPASADPGADYAWYRPTAAELAGTRVVVRYLVPASWGSGKALSASEARWLRTGGHPVALVFEWSATGARGGYPAGARDARNAELARAEVGAPVLPVYFAIDWDVTPGEVPTVLAYLDGAGSVIGRGRVGVYGGYRVVVAAGDAGYRWLWQTYAWSGGRWDPRARLRQVRNDALWHGQGDLDDIQGDVGAWPPVAPTDNGNGDLVPVHQPPGPPPTVWYRVRPGDTLSAIAARFGTSWPELARANHLANPNLIYPGQLLAITGRAPAPAPAPTSWYRVRAGDTLSAIAARFGTTWPTLARINALRNPNLIYPGQLLRLR